MNKSPRLTLPFPKNSKQVQTILIAGYVGFVALCFFSPLSPRIFWTILLPLLPASIVLMGFYNWRRICPLAYWGSLGVRYKRKGVAPRRVPAWMENWFLVISGGFLVSMLVVRLVLINGDGPWLGLTLTGLGLLAATSNYFFHGRTWCNFICPVGMVERIYTDPNSLRNLQTNSQCDKCTACKKHCPDIDQEKSYWKDISLLSRQIAFFGFPGVVLGFYSYYYLRHGSWDAYFDGKWTRTPASANLAFGPGFFFAPKIPAVLAAAMTLLGFAAISYCIFTLIEKVLSRWVKEKEQRSHLTQTVAAFTAFNIFYIFAGAPTLRLIPGAVRVVAFLVPLISSLFLVKRWQRSQETFLKEQSVKLLLRKWPFKEPPPSHPLEVLTFVKTQEKSHEVQLGAYTDTVREMLAEGEIRQRDLRLLGQLRQDLGVSEAEHRKIVTAFSEEEKNMLDTESAARAELRLQLAGYRDALSNALVHNLPASDLETLRIDYGISSEVHDSLLQELRGQSGVLLQRIDKQFERLEQIRAQICVLAGHPEIVSQNNILFYVLRKAQERTVCRIIDTLAVIENNNKIHDLKDGLFVDELDERLSRLKELRSMTTDNNLCSRLEPVIQNWFTETTPTNQDQFLLTVNGLAASTDPYQRAGAMAIISSMTPGQKISAPGMNEILIKGLADLDPVVRETAIYNLSAESRQLAVEAAQQLQDDPDMVVRKAANNILQSVDRSQSSFGMLSTLEKMQVLWQVPIFSTLDPEDLHELSGVTIEQTITAPEALVRQGDSGDDLFIIVNGTADVVVDKQGVDQVINQLSPGDVVGELSALDGSPRSATVRPKTESLQVLKLNRKDFRRLLGKRPEMAQTVMTIITKRLRQSLDNYVAFQDHNND